MDIRKASQQEYAAHIKIVRRYYPVDLAQAGSSSLQETKGIAYRQLDASLPKGRRTPDHFFYTFFDKSIKIGYLWVQRKEEGTLFICSIYILAKFRSKGYGSMSMQWLKSKSRQLGCNELLLHVFGHNRRAIDFYLQHGFSIQEKNPLPSMHMPSMHMYLKLE